MQLQAAAMDSGTSVSEVLRKALAVATKLNVPEFRAWIQRELHGYSSNEGLPEYRIVKGELKSWNPYLGSYIPVRFSKNPKIGEMLSQRSVLQRLGEIEDATVDKDGYIEMPLSAETITKIFANDRNYQMGLIPSAA
jgi:hypothetical protein